MTLKTLLREADWFDGARARGYLNILAAVESVAILGWSLASGLNGGLDPSGKPLGADFPSFWAASKLALGGQAPLAWQVGPHFAVQRAAFGGAGIGYSAFFYPPPYLLACLPLALLPYLPSLAVWLVATAGVMARALKPLIRDGRTWLALAAYPAVLSNLGHGQNAFLTTGLFAFGLLQVEKRPWIAGLLLGLLVIKPHLALVLPVILIGSGRWKTVVATGATALALCGVSYLAFGSDAWSGFMATGTLARAALEQNLVGNEKMQSAFAAVRLLGGSLTVAWTVQAVVSFTGLSLLAWGSLKCRDTEARAAMAASAALMVSPFLLDYDLMLAAVPLLWLLQAARAKGFLAYEKLGLVAVFLLPLVSRLAAGALHLPLAPIVLAGLLALVLRRALGAQGPSAALGPLSNYP